MTTPDAPSDTCPRCGAPFHCGVHDDTPCACTTLQLDDALLMQLRVRFSGCLCLRCLSALAGGEPLELPAPAPPAAR
ncbi:cysteine-rich CWC family protein [Azohydromonas sediminis]|uniref:cysteine-rich CWC family protein n=1 Tax=Azohydromonas sediminis TaxID=2259674 RepID=UPI000E65A88E|nr:cysteine-rich CWC family protein [Azohydromonas sediminis]